MSEYQHAVVCIKRVSLDADRFLRTHSEMTPSSTLGNTVDCTNRKLHCTHWVQSRQGRSPGGGPYATCAMYLPAQLPSSHQYLHSVRVNIPSSQLGSNIRQNRRLDPLFSASTSIMPVKLPISKQNSSRRQRVVELL